jgi:hypothetical protein
MAGAPTVGEATPAAIIPSTYAADRLLRLHDTLVRLRAVEQMLHGPERDQARALLGRAAFTLYLDCREAGVGDDARRLLAGAHTAGESGASAASDPVPPTTSVYASGMASPR